MSQARCVLIVVLNIMGCVLGNRLLYGQADAQTAGDFKAQLAEAVGQLRSSDFGAAGGPMAAIAKLVVASDGKPQERRELAVSLAGVLGSNAPDGAKSFVCRQLAMVGGAEQVPALAARAPLGAT